MTKKILTLLFLTLFLPIGICFVNPAEAALPTGNRLKDPYAILRNSLPINEESLRELQHTLEDTSDLIRGNRWPAINQAASKSVFLVNTNEDKVLQSLPASDKKKGIKILSELKDSLQILNEEASLKNKSNFLEIRRKALREIGD